MEKPLHQQYTEVQILKWLIRTKRNPIEVIALMMDESRLKEQMEVVIDMNEGLKGVETMKGISERTIHRRFQKLGISERPYAGSKIVAQNQKK